MPELKTIRDHLRARVPRAAPPWFTKTARDGSQTEQPGVPGSAGIAEKSSYSMTPYLYLDSHARAQPGLRRSGRRKAIRGMHIRAWPPPLRQVLATAGENGVGSRATWARTCLLPVLNCELAGGRHAGLDVSINAPSAATCTRGRKGRSLRENGEHERPPDYGQCQSVRLWSVASPSPSWRGIAAARATGAGTGAGRP